MLRRALQLSAGLALGASTAFFSTSSTSSFPTSLTSNLPAIPNSFPSLPSFSSPLLATGFAAASAPPAALFSWGSNRMGQLGHGDELPRSLPTEVLELQGVKCKAFDAGGESSAIVTEDGELYTFGSALDCRLGHGDDAFQATPRLVEALLEHKIASVACSAYHMAAVSEDGVAFTWGRDWSGQLGHGARASSRAHNLPRAVQMPEAGIRVQQVALGSKHSLFLTQDGRVFACGSNDAGALGLGADRAEKDTPVEIKGCFDGKKIVQVACGADYSVCLDEDGDIWSFGKNTSGQLAQGDTMATSLRVPTRVGAFGHRKVQRITCGRSHAIAQTTDGRLYTWGEGREGQLGTGDKHFHNSMPRMIVSLMKLKVDITDVSCGGGHSAAVDSNGNLYMWGRGRDGQLGRGDGVESIASYHTSPKMVQWFNKHNKPIRRVALGADHSLGLVEEGA